MMGNKTMFRYSVNYGEYYGVIVSTSKTAAKRKLIDTYGNGNVIGIYDFVGMYNDKDIVEIGRDAVK